jgi:phosphate transport system permease protein
MVDKLTNRKRWGEEIIQNLFLLCAILIVLIIFGIFIFVGYNGLQLFALDHASASTFFTSTNWNLDPTQGKVSYGALGYILGSVVTTALAMLIVAPLAMGMAIFMAELSPRWLERILRPLLEIFTGMPSVVVGFLGLVVLVPWVGRLAAPIAPVAATAGYGWATASIVLVIMVLPTVVSISIDALRAVPVDVREASLSLGSTHWQMIKNAVLPAAKTGLATALLLGTGRAIGETFAVTMVLKAQNALPIDLLTPGAFFQPNINIPLGIVSYFSEAPTPAARSACIMLGFVLLVIAFLFICMSRFLASRSVYR